MTDADTTQSTESERPDAVVLFENKYAPDCGDCGTRTDFRGIQDEELVQWICPHCTPDRIRITFGIPDGFEVVERPENPQLTLTEALSEADSR